MTTEIDERVGLVKTYWKDINHRVATAEPEFAEIVNQLSPDKKFPLYLAYYPYGSILGDTKSSIFPKDNQTFYRITDSSTPSDVVKNLGYSANHTPLLMVLEKQLEIFIDLEKFGITIPHLIYQSGDIVPFSRTLRTKSNRVYAPNKVLSATSGARSVFMLPSIGCANDHSKLQRDFNVQSPAPKSLYQHWDIFRQICQSSTAKLDWSCCILYFSKTWEDALHNDPAWAPLKKYLHEKAWKKFEYDINRIYYDMIFSIIQQERNLKPNPYLADTAKHLFATALGAAPGYAPAMNEEALPLSILQTAFIHSYGMEKYYPTIMQPTHFNFEKDTAPIYYSIQHPSVHVFAPKSRKISSTLVELRELEHIMRVFATELGRSDGMCSDTILCEVARKAEFSYFHSKPDKHQVVYNSTEIAKRDKRFKYCAGRKKPGKTMTFGSDAPFVRGCVSIFTK